MTTVTPRPLNDDTGIHDDATIDPDAAPETVNAEQQDAPDQAQTVTEDALNANTAVEGLSDSAKPKSGDIDDDVQDLVDHMNQMDRSGLIDMDAFRGEPNDDDEEGRFGPYGERP